MQRTLDWLRQSKKDLEHARKSLDMGDFEWSCFSAQQSAEKAVKALYQGLRADTYGHSMSTLLLKLPKSSRAQANLVAAAKLLDRHYIPTIYPNSHPQGAPMDYYTRRDAEEAVRIAERIVRFCQDRIRRSTRES